MPAPNSLGELLTTLFDRRVADPRPIADLCKAAPAVKTLAKQAARQVDA